MPAQSVAEPPQTFGCVPAGCHRARRASHAEAVKEPHQIRQAVTNAASATRGARPPHRRKREIFLQLPRGALQVRKPLALANRKPSEARRDLPMPPSPECHNLHRSRYCPSDRLIEDRQLSDTSNQRSRCSDAHDGSHSSGASRAATSRTDGTFANRSDLPRLARRDSRRPFLLWAGRRPRHRCLGQTRCSNALPPVCTRRPRLHLVGRALVYTATMFLRHIATWRRCATPLRHTATAPQCGTATGGRIENPPCGRNQLAQQCRP
jgi:hypothetical protein